MALGRKLRVWDAEQMIRGVSTSTEVPDGGFSPETDAVNLIAEPGVCYSSASPTDKSTNLTGQIIASCEDPAGSAARLYVSADSDQDGRFYSANTTGDLTARGSEDTGANYIQGSCDAIGFQGEAYVTNSTYIVRWQQPATINLTFHGFNDTTAPHPALVYESNAYFGDGNELKRMTAAGGTVSVVLTLQANEVIVALGVDPGSGKMLISVVSQYNISDSVNSDAKVLYYNGFSNKSDKVVPVDQMITAFPTSEGGVYAAYGKNLGYWNGAGVTFLRSFPTIDFDNTQLLYKHHFTNIGSTLYFIVRHRVFAHGPIIQNGPKVFYPMYSNTPGGSAVDLTNVVNLGSNLLSFSYATSKFYTLNTTSIASTNTQVLYSNEDSFPEYNDGIWLTRVKIFWKSQISNGIDPGSIRFLNEDGVISTIGQSGIFDLVNSSGAAKAMTEITIGGGTGLRVYQLQWNILLDGINPGIRRVEIWGNEANVT